MVGTRASGYATEIATTKPNNEKHENAQEQPQKRRVPRPRQSQQDREDNIEQLSSRVKSFRSNARTYPVRNSSSYQSNRERHASETSGEQLRNNVLHMTPNTRKASGFRKSMASGSDTISNESNATSAHQENSEKLATKYMFSAVMELEQDSTQESSDRRRSKTLKQASYPSEDGSSEFDSDSDTEADAQYVAGIHKAKYHNAERRNRLHIQPNRSSSLIFTEADPLNGTDYDFQKYQRNAHQTRDPRVLSADFPSIDDQVSQTIPRFQDNLGRTRNLEHSSDVSLYGYRKSGSLSSLRLQDEPILPRKINVWPGDGADCTGDHDEAAVNDLLQQSTQKSFSKIFVKHMRDGTRFWYKKPLSFWLSVTLSGWMCSYLLCSAQNACEKSGQIYILATSFLQSPLDVACFFGVTQLICLGILDIVGGLINVFANIGMYTAHQASEMDEDKDGHPFTRSKARRVSTLWIGVLIDVLENVLEPLAMVTSIFAFDFLLHNKTWKHWLSAFGSDGFRGCFISLCLHLAKWGIQASEDYFDLYKPPTYPRKCLQRPVTTAMFVVLLLLTVYVYREFLTFDVVQTWGHAIAYSQGGGYRVDDKRVVRRITADLDFWTRGLARTVRRVATNLVTGIVVPGAL